MWGGWVLLGAALLVGCSSSEPDGVQTGDDDEIIGGVEASGAQLNAIGSMGRRDSWTNELSYFCTATLVAPTVVLSAKHCAQSGPDGIVFMVGPDSKKPIQTVPVKEIVHAPDGEGGFVELGQDVALFLLSEPVKDVKPLRYINGHIPEGRVGSKLTAVGYGVRDRERNSGQRRAGALTVHAVSGKPIAKHWPDREDFYRFFVANDGQSYVDSNKPKLDKFYDLELKADSEAYLGLGDGDAQPCSGDSGGPLIGRLNGENVVFAVVSGSFKTRTYPCSVVGEVYATLGPGVQSMLAQAIGSADQAVDPTSGAAKPPAELSACQGVSFKGLCDGTTAVRCVTSAEGPVKVTKTDCDLIGQTCGLDPSGAAACVDVPETGGAAGAGGSGAGGASGGAGPAAGAAGQAASGAGGQGGSSGGSGQNSAGTGGAGGASGGSGQGTGGAG